ncbi:MAG: hypothetical protein JRI56_00140 [Deltaproteobacteria bacterium]|nr:hypothetical protein [Deltaproteobacteria bacterium]
MKAEIKNGKLVITLDANTKEPPDSKSGKSKIIATTGGNVLTGLQVNGKQVFIGVNAFIKN